MQNQILPRFNLYFKFDWQMKIVNVPKITETYSNIKFGHMTGSWHPEKTPNAQRFGLADRACCRGCGLYQDSQTKSFDHEVLPTKKTSLFTCGLGPVLLGQESFSNFKVKGNPSMLTAEGQMKTDGCCLLFQWMKSVLMLIIK